MAGSKRVWDLRELRDVVIPDGVERIGNHWFWGSGIESLAVPASVREICVDAFSNCRRLKEVTIKGNSNLKTIGESAFYQCESLANINLPEGLETI